MIKRSPCNGNEIHHNSSDLLIFMVLFGIQASPTFTFKTSDTCQNMNTNTMMSGIRIFIVGSVPVLPRATVSCCCCCFCCSRLFAASFFGTAQQDHTLDSLNLNPSPVSEFLRRELGFSEFQISKIQNSSPSLLKLRSTKTAAEVMELLKSFGLDRCQLNRYFYRDPFALCRREKSLRQRLQVLQDDVGLSGQALAEVISKAPRILTFKDPAARIRVLQSLLGQDLNTLKVVMEKYPNVLAFNAKAGETRLELLKQCGMQDAVISYLIYRFPHVLFTTPRRMLSAIDYLKNLGINVSSRIAVNALCALMRSSGRWQESEEALLDSGLSKEEMKQIIRQKPSIVTFSPEMLRRKMRFLFALAGISPKSLVSNPALLTYSLEKRMQPRLEIYNYLSLTQPPAKLPSLSNFFSISHQRLMTKYVDGNSDVKKLLEIMAGSELKLTLLPAV